MLSDVARIERLCNGAFGWSTRPSETVARYSIATEIGRYIESWRILEHGALWVGATTNGCQHGALVSRLK